MKCYSGAVDTSSICIPEQCSGLAYSKAKNGTGEQRAGSYRGPLKRFILIQEPLVCLLSRYASSRGNDAVKDPHSRLKDERMHCR